jgi:hypothetical protein
MKAKISLPSRIAKSMHLQHLEKKNVSMSVMVDEQHQSGRVSGEGYIWKCNHLRQQPEIVRQLENKPKQHIIAELNLISHNPITTNFCLEKDLFHIPVLHQPQQQKPHPQDFQETRRPILI